ncbi:MAG TPA: penicillin-binding protein activator [Kofleriaceae bacterium]|nr:penicillin-binding protein activator [Kofleriaceae bacterium]
MIQRLGLCVVVLAACHHTRKTLVPEVPHNGNAAARQRYLDAQARFLGGGKGDEFAKIVDDYPDDPIAPWAELSAGIAAIQARHFADADAQLAKVLAGDAPAGLAARARMFLGIAKNYEGDTAAARNLLANVPDAAIENDAERTEEVAAVAYATAAGDKPLASIQWFDELYARVDDAQRAAIVAREDDLLAAADPKALTDLAGGREPSSVLARGRLVALGARTDPDVGAARAKLGLPRTLPAVDAGVAGGGEPGLIGAVVPLGGASLRVGEAAVAGLGLVAGAPDGKGVAAIETRVALDTTAAEEAVDELARGRVVAIVGPIEKHAVDAAAVRAEGLGVPLISLATASEQRAGGRFVFHVRHSPEARARVLAQRALAAGIKRLLVLAPTNDYGKAVGAAFAEAVKKGGGTVVDTVMYSGDTTAIVKVAKGLSSDWQGVFVPTDADDLAVIAEALAAAGQVPMPAGTKETKGTKKAIGGRPVVLLSTAEGLAGKYIAAAGRHSEGALLAPGFYPDDADPIAKPFIDRFVAAYGRAPGATEAYAYDAAQLAAAAGAHGRTALASELAKAQLPGVTGTIQFDAEHRRADPGLVYTVVQETGGVYAIRVAK